MDDYLYEGFYDEPGHAPPATSDPAFNAFDYELELEPVRLSEAKTPSTPAYDYELDALLDAPASPSAALLAASRQTSGELHEYEYDFDFELELEVEPVRQQSDHSVLFYGDAADRARQVAKRISAALAAQQVALIVATSQHAAELLGAIANAQAFVTEGRLVVLDAEQLRASIIRNGLPDGALFERHVAEPVRGHVRRSPRLHVYGEMVTMMWLEGNVVAAMQLERLWNALLQEATLSVLCAYPLAEVQEAGAGFAEICELHTAAHVR